MERRSIVNWISFLLVGLHLNAQAQDDKIWDIRPATTWMTEAYPMGNGRIGGMVYGGTTYEHIQLNENTLWTGDESNTGAYQDLGDLFIELRNMDTVENYRRELDLGSATQNITYTSSGTTYRREYFCSFPDQVMVLHFTADKKGAYTAIIRLKDAHAAKTTTEGLTLDINGALDNGLNTMPVPSYDWKAVPPPRHPTAPYRSTMPMVSPFTSPPPPII